MWGRQCRGAHGSASLVGVTLLSQEGSGWFVPKAGGHQNRRVWQEQAKPGPSSLGESSSFAIPVPGLEAREVPDTAQAGHEGAAGAQQPRAVPG